MLDLEYHPGAVKSFETFIPLVAVIVELGPSMKSHRRYSSISCVHA